MPYSPLWSGTESGAFVSGVINVHVFRLEQRGNGRVGIYGLLGHAVERYTALPSYHPEFTNRCRTLILDRVLIKNLPADAHVRPRGYHCGFKDLDQLFNWFPKAKLNELAKEASDDIALGVYEVPAMYVAVGEFQVFFLYDEATQLAQLEPNACNRGDCWETIKPRLKELELEVRTA